jgi:hypothetical protein
LDQTSISFPALEKINEDASINKTPIPSPDLKEANEDHAIHHKLLLDFEEPFVDYNSKDILYIPKCSLCSAGKK